jgi:hypothetical protein
MNDYSLDPIGNKQKPLANLISDLIQKQFEISMMKK